RALVEGHEAELTLPRVDLEGRTLGEALLTPTRIYATSVLDLVRSDIPVKAMAHITGGGITENLNRVLPSGCGGVVARASWGVPRLIQVLCEAAALSDDEAYKTFNMGIGFAIVLDPKHAPAAAVRLRAAGERVYEIGEIAQGSGIVRYEG
ncbi:MAG: phosphoribosylformylglycinamidine cyclo-ligase, partial [Actinobacteria bacterium]